MPRAQRYSKKREAILTLLHSTGTHPSAEWIHTRMRELYPDISLGTVYRNLAQFKEQGCVVSVATVNGVERFDANVEPHIHLICQNCGRVQDLSEMEIPASLCFEAARHSGAKVRQCWVTFHGDCADCKNIQKQ